MLIERGVIKSNISVVEDGEYKKIGCQQRAAYFYIRPALGVWSNASSFLFEAGVGACTVSVL